MALFDSRDVKFYSTQELNEGEMYKHVLQDKKLYITKDDTTILELDSDQIGSMLKALGVVGRDFFNGCNGSEWS